MTSTTHLEGGKKSWGLCLGAFWGLDDIQICSLIVCQPEAHPRGLRKSCSCDLSSWAETGRQEKQFQELATVFRDFKSTSKSDDDMTLGEMQISKRKECQEIKLWDNWKFRLYRPVPRTTLLLTLLPFRVKVRCPSGSPLPDDQIREKHSNSQTTQLSIDFHFSLSMPSTFCWSF